MLGYMTVKEAVSHGFTHHGSYYGIPCWIAPDAGFMVATKWAPLEHLMTIFHVIEGVIGVVFLEREPAFKFLVGEEIQVH